MRLKRNSATTLETADARLAGLKKITPAPDFDPPLSVTSFETEINGFRVDQETYNAELAALDDRLNRLGARARIVDDLSQRVLAAVKAKYGPDSSEYEMVGGTRRSEHKKRTSAPKKTS